MKITVTESKLLQLEEVFLPIILKTKKGEEIVIRMRDSGFEFEYQGGLYSAQNGKLVYVQELSRNRKIKLKNI